jgi:hypothetical protein
MVEGIPLNVEPTTTVGNELFTMQNSCCMLAGGFKVM